MEEFKNIDFESQRTRYFSDFAKSHLKQMRVLAEGGVLGFGNESWRNVSEHCLVEAVGADILAEALGAQRDKVVEASLLHDWYKRREIEAMDSVGVAQGFKESTAKDEEGLRCLGVSEEIIKLAHSNVLDSIDRKYLDQRTLEQKIMHLIDVSTDGSSIINPLERIRLSWTRPKSVAFSDSFKEMYGGKNLFDVQRDIVLEEQHEFEEKIGLEPGTLTEFIYKKLLERVTNS